MMYLLAIILPPLAMFLCGKPIQAVIALILQVTVLGWLPAAIWACFVVNGSDADARNKKLIKAIERNKKP